MVKIFYSDRLELTFDDFFIISIDKEQIIVAH